MKIVGSAFLAGLLLNSCYSYTSVVGEGAQGNREVTQWNHYLVYGLAPVDVTDSKAMAEGAENYEVKTEQTFINGLVTGLTFGLYAPTTTTVKR